jgi:hypothetical protein
MRLSANFFMRAKVLSSDYLLVNGMILNRKLSFPSGWLAHHFVSSSATAYEHKDKGSELRITPMHA